MNIHETQIQNRLDQKQPCFQNLTLTTNISHKLSLQIIKLYIILLQCSKGKLNLNFFVRNL